MIMIKEKDFVEVSYVGKIKDSNHIFDLTSAELAKSEKMYNPNAQYGNKVICLGQKNILPEIDKQLIGKEVGKEYKIELSPEKSFGVKDPTLVKIVSTDILRKQNVNPFPGLTINASGLMGTIRSVSGGRTTIDFNHPLSGKNIVYEIKIERIISEDKEKIEALLTNFLGLSEKDYELKLEIKKLEVKLKVTIPNQAKEEFKTKVNELINDMEVSFV